MRLNKTKLLCLLAGLAIIFTAVSCSMDDNGDTVFSGYIARWNFDSNIDDETGNYDLAVTEPVSGTPAYDTVNYKEGTASGLFDEGTTLSSPDISFAGNEFSVAFWAYVDPEYNEETPEFINWADYGFFVYPDLEFGFICYGVNDGNHEDSEIISAHFTEDTWYHFVLTYDGYHLMLYINNERELISGCSADIRDLAGPILFGSGDDDYFLNGCIDDVILYDRTLTAAEVNTLYSSY